MATTGPIGLRSASFIDLTRPHPLSCAVDALSKEPRAALRTALQDRYALEEEIGSGSMSVVYGARDLKHDRPVAIKVLRAELTGAIGEDRFHREGDRVGDFDWLRT